MSETARAREYERLYPGAVNDEGQRAERMERITYREERDAHRRTNRRRGVLIPALPWQREEDA